jgi:hypothetical protein
MQSDPERKPKHRAEYVESECNCNTNPDADIIDHAHGLCEPDPNCKCDPLLDGYADPDCNTHGIPIQPRPDSMGRRE